jgi:hypothetical protein
MIAALKFLTMLSILLVSLVVLLCIDSSTAFVVPTLHHRVAPGLSFSRRLPWFDPSSTTLHLSKDNNNEEENNTDPLGISRGAILFLVVASANLWLFSVPPEFRRARNCSEEQVLLYPDRKCMTTEMWWGGIADYYRNGGGFQFDFSMEGNE